MVWYGVNMEKRIVLEIGHSFAARGAVNDYFGMSEFIYNESIVQDLKRMLLGNPDIDARIVYRVTTYLDLPKQINTLNPHFVISFHANAFNKTAAGSEVLYYHSSLKGKRMAEIWLRHIVETLGLPNRGVKPKHEEDRGGHFLKYTHAPAIILEPFFIDNNLDYQTAQNNRKDLLLAYVDAVNETIKI